MAVGEGSRQEEPSRRSYHRFACGAVLGSPLLLPLAIPRCAPSPSPAAASGSSIRFSEGDRRRNWQKATEGRSVEAEPRRKASGAAGLRLKGRGRAAMG